MKPTLVWELDRAAQRLAAHLSDRPFLTGDAPTIPDLLAGHCLGWAAKARMPMKAPGLDAYLTRLRSRPAYRRAQQIGRDARQTQTGD